MFVFGIWNYKFTELNRLREEGAKHTHNKNSNMDFFSGMLVFIHISFFFFTFCALFNFLYLVFFFYTFVCRYQAMILFFGTQWRDRKKEKHFSNFLVAWLKVLSDHSEKKTLIMLDIILVFWKDQLFISKFWKKALKHSKILTLLFYISSL